MDTRQFLIGLASALVIVSGSAVADDIYKWTDAEGNVHYEDRPSGAGTEERIKVASRRTDNSAVQKRVQNRLDSQATRQEAKAAAAAEAQTAADKAAEAEAQKKQCATYRQQLEVVIQSRRVYKETADGEREYLDDTGKQAARSRLEDLVRETCN